MKEIKDFSPKDIIVMLLGTFTISIVGFIFFGDTISKELQLEVLFSSSFCMLGYILHVIGLNMYKISFLIFCLGLLRLFEVDSLYIIILILTVSGIKNYIEKKLSNNI